MSIWHMENHSSPPLRIGIVLLSEFTMMAFAGFSDVLRLASDHGGHSRQILIHWDVFSTDGEPRRSSSGTLVTELTDLPADPGEFDYIAICGGNSFTRKTSKKLANWIKLAYDKGVIMLGLCTGTFALAQAGVAKDHKVCIHWNVTDEFNKQFPNIKYSVDNLFIDSGHLITCAGSSAVLDLALYILKRHLGTEKTQQAMRHMMLHTARSAHWPQAHFRVILDDVSDPRIHKAVHFLEQRIDDLPSISKVADHIGISHRQLVRLFNKSLGLTPSGLYRNMRLQYGKWQLKNTRKSITDIAISCGFSDNSHFTKAFRLYFGQTPSLYRRKSE